MQHRYNMQKVAGLKPTARRVGEVDYSDYWKKALYFDEALGIYQPANHIEGAMIKAAVNFQITGKGKKTYKDLFRSAVFVSPDYIPHNKFEPDEIDTRLVKVNNSAIERQRPMLKDWSLDFDIQILEEQIHEDVVRQVLDHAGRYIGIGDFRPRYGRFAVAKFGEV